MDEGASRSHWILIGILAVAFVSVSVYAHLHPGEPAAARPMSEPAVRGFQVWRRSNCQACHQIYGLGGYLGPDLTDAGGRLSRSRIEEVLTRGTTPMPRFDLSEAERSDLYEFLLYVDQTGNWPASGWPPPGFAGDR